MSAVLHKLLRTTRDFYLQARELIYSRDPDRYVHWAADTFCLFLVSTLCLHDASGTMRLFFIFKTIAGSFEMRGFGDLELVLLSRRSIVEQIFYDFQCFFFELYFGCLDERFVRNLKMQCPKNMFD